MQKKLLLPLIIVMLSTVLLRAEWIPLAKQNTTPAPPNVTLVSDDNNSTVLKIEISGFELKDFISGESHYQKIDLLSESFTNNPGFPELPYIAKVLAVPDQAGISIEILELGEIQKFNGIYLPPARKSWFEGSPETPYTEKSDVYNSMSSYPGEFVQLDPPSVFRDFRITRVSVFPVRYIPAKKELQAVSSITVRINYGPGEVINPKIGPKKPIAPTFGKLYQELIFNYQDVLNKSYGGKENGHELMLCIMPDEFITSFQIYADWKRQSGIDIHVTKFSDIGANATDPDIIKNHIADAYHNWDVPPTYVLIIGDDGIFPKKLVTLDGWTFPNEDFFVEIDGNDYFPELMIGRFTNQGDYRLQVMINKFIMYEKTPDISSTDWFKKGICCSNDAYASQIETKRFAANRMLLDGGFTSVDTMMSDPGCTYSVADVVNAINEGRSWLNYRGEGWSSGWWATCTPMVTSDVSGLTNGPKFPFVTSIGCGVAMFDAGGNNCFGEEWVERGSLTSPQGAAAFVGPTSNTHTAYNNNIDRGIYKGMFQEGMDTPGQALLRGKLEMYNVFGGGDSYVPYHYKIYCVLGDPSIHIWKDIPQAVTVNYPASIPFGNNTVEFTVTHTASGQPVANALVCVTGNTIFITGNTDETGKAYLDITANAPETLTVTVRGGNVFPFQGTMSVLQPTGPYIIKESYTLNDNTGGNGNGIMETSETILASLTVKNVGIATATNVIITLGTTDEYVTVTDNTESYGTILPGATAVIPNGFEWEVANNIPDLHNVIFEISATDGTGIWTSYISVAGHGPLIELGSMIIDDSQGNNNDRMDPGETVDLIIQTYNNGSFQATGAVGSLNCTNGYITPNNTSFDFGVIGAGQMEEAIFSVTVAADAPIGTGVSFIFNVATEGYFIQEVFTTTIGLIIEDWETGDMNQFNWTTGGTSNWAISSTNSYEGNYCIKSGPLGDNQNNYLSLQYETFGTDSISFWHKVSSEVNYDYLRFYIDNVEQSSWSGQTEWERNAYAVTAGDHTFKWTYSKDQSVASGSDCSWVDYIVLPASVFEAYFSSNETNICEGESVSFYDQSPSGTISWDWVFEGGTPGTSTLQNPVIQYLTSGSYDVSLTISNGTATNTLVLENYITVSTLPGAAPAPTGPTLVCANSGNSSYNTAGLSGISDYDWLLEPTTAGNVSGTGLYATVIWDGGFLGEATLKVAGENICGTGAYSNPILITRYLPDVTIEPFDWVCVGWPAFELTGGMPAGGEYSGPGVENGWFDPAMAGVGTHTITYTYTDPNNCENSAIETILVDPCTGINDPDDLPGLRIYPNPTTGMITVDFDQNITILEVTVINTLNTVVYAESTEKRTGNRLNIDLSNLAKGIYFIKLKTDKKEQTMKVILQ
jgi:PKD repeat protein